MSGNNRFVFIACHYDMEKTVGRMLHSICGQSYTNWKLIITDDVSPGYVPFDVGCIVDRFQDLHTVPDGAIVYQCNTEKRWETLNVLNMIREHTEPNDIVCRIDCDDYLTDLDALAIIDAAYQQSGCDALWTAHRWGMSDRNISGPMQDGADPYVHPWVSSHLKTFRRHLLDGVNEENFKGADGNYIRRTGDQALYLPALWNAKKRVYLPRALYHYTINDVPETYQTDDAKFQRDEGIFLRQRGYVK